MTNEQVTQGWLSGQTDFPHDVRLVLPDGARSEGENGELVISARTFAADIGIIPKRPGMR
jgi:hypothetical protein